MIADPRWIVERELGQPPRIVEVGLGRWQDERRAVCTMSDNSILSHEYADKIVRLWEEAKHLQRQLDRGKWDAFGPPGMMGN